MTQPAWQPNAPPGLVAEPHWHLIRLRRDGQPPLRFEGQLVAHFDGQMFPAQPNTSDATAPVWHEIALYRVATGGYAVQITALMIGAVDATAEVVACCAAMRPTLEDAVTAIEQHDAAQAATPGRAVPSIDFTDPNVSPAQLMLQATRLAALQRDIVRRYRIAVGGLLFALAGTMLRA